MKRTPIEISDGTLEALKWAALVLMVLDHINKYIYGGEIRVLFYAGRVCFPLFALILAYNLARGDALSSGCHQRLLTRLVVFGAIATPAFWVLGIPFFVLNIMFALAVGVLCIWLFDEGGRLNTLIGWLAFVVLGAFVEFWWFGLAVMVSGWYFFRSPTIGRAVLLLSAVASLSIVNQNLYALLALAVLFVAPYLSVSVPRWKYLFYGFYPLHLFAILGIKAYVL